MEKEYISVNPETCGLWLKDQRHIDIVCANSDYYEIAISKREENENKC